MDNTIFFLAGHAGVGKLTVAREIAALTGAKVAAQGRLARQHPAGLRPPERPSRRSPHITRLPPGEAARLIVAATARQTG